MRKLKRNSSLIAVLACLAALAAASLAVAGTKDKDKAPSNSIIQPDKGKFNILLNGNSVGHEEFTIEPSGAGWAVKGTTELKAPQSPATKVTGDLTLQSDGTPVAYKWTSQSDKTNGAEILFANGIAKITLQMQGARPFEQDLSFGSPMVVVLDNNLYHQYAILARLYDWSKKGIQTLPVLIPQDLTPGTITVESVGEAASGGKSYEGLKVSTSDLEVELLLDSNHKLMRLEVPAAKVAVIRE